MRLIATCALGDNAFFLMISPGDRKIQYYTKEMVRKYHKDPFDLLHDSQALAHAQLADVLQEQRGHHQIDQLLDVAVGLAKSFEWADREFEVANFIGNDYSQVMLDQAQKIFPNFTPIRGDAIDVHKQIAPESIDVAYAHYVLSYVNMATLLRSVHTTLRPGGLISITTSTWENLRSFQELVEASVPRLFNREKYIAQYQGKIPQDSDELITLLTQNGFEVLRVDPICKEITMHTFNEFWSYFAEAGWHVQASRITGRLAVDKVLWRLGINALKLTNKKLRFPVSSKTNLCAVVARKIAA